MAAKKGGRPTKFRQAVALIEGESFKGHLEFFRSNGSLWVQVREGRKRQQAICERVDSVSFKRRLVGMYYDEFRDGLDGATQQQVVDLLQATYLNKGTHPTYDLALRVGWHEGVIYLDLGDTTREVVMIGPRGWNVVWNGGCPVRFRRSPSMLPLPRPVKGGKLNELRELLGLEENENGHNWVFVVGHLLDAMFPRGPHALLCVTGEHGSAKTTTSRILRTLTDPSMVWSRTLPKNTDDANVGAQNSWVLCFDNCSKIEPKVSDWLCRLATGAADATRTFYHQDSEVVYSSKNPVILNAIGTGIVSRPDLRDRTLPVHLPPMLEDRRDFEQVLWKRFEAAHPRLLGALFDVVSAALAREGEVTRKTLPRWPRLADLTRWVTQAEPALGWEQGTFARAVLTLRAHDDSDIVENSAVGRAVLELMKGKKIGEAITGTPEEILAKVRPHIDVMANDRPDTARGLRAMLDRIQPNLRRLGVEFTGNVGSDGRSWRFHRVELEKRPLDDMDSLVDSLLA